MTKSRMIYIGVLLVALAVLFWDKTSRPQSVVNPKPAQAYYTPSVQPKNPDVTAKTDTVKNTINLNHNTKPNNPTSPQTKEQESISRNPSTQNFLQTFFAGERKKIEQQGTRNLFIASEGFSSLIQEASQQDTNETKIFEAAKKLQLSGILLGCHNRCALINSEVTFIGQNIGPFEVVEIFPDSVILQIDSERIILSLSE